MKLDEKVSKYYDRLNPNDRIIWQYINSHRGECCNLSIDELALCCNVSRSTVMRFAQKLGMRGFSELKAFIRWECGDFQDTGDDLVEEACSSAIQIIERFRDMDCDGIFRLFQNANQIFVYGTGCVQRDVATEFTRMFLNVNVLVHKILGEGEFHSMLRVMTEDDVVLIISKSGENAFIKDILVALKSKKIPIISLTHSGSNTLANMSDYNLFLNYGKHQVFENMYFEQTAELFLVMQILFIKYVMYMKNLSI